MNKKILSSILLGCIVTTNAFAIPTIYPQTDSIDLLNQIHNNTDSNLIGDTENPYKVYVMPPNSAKAIVQKKLSMRTANLGFCGQMKNLQESSNRASEEIGNFKKLLKIKKTELDANYELVVKAQEELKNYAQLNNLNEILSLDEKIKELTNLISIKLEAKKSCENNCNEIKNEIQLLTSQRDEAENLSFKLTRTLAKDKREYSRLKEYLDNLEENQARISKKYKAIYTDLAEINETIVSLYKNLGNMEGGRASINFKSEWSNNINSLINENNGFEFEKILTKNAIFTTDIIDISELPTSSSVLAYKISTCASGTGSICKASAYPEDFSGTVVLSTIGACPIEYPEFFLNKKSPTNTAEDLAFGLTVAYEYETAMNISAIVKYNMHKVMERFKESGRRGGIFRTKAWSSVTEKDFFKDAYSVKWLSQDTEVELPPEEALAKEEQIRNHIFSRLAALSVPGSMNPGELVLPLVPKSGSIVLSDELAKNPSCQLSSICTGANIIVNVLSSIFGGDTSTNSYIKTEDKDITETWSSTKTITKSYVTSYSK